MPAGGDSSVEAYEKITLRLIYGQFSEYFCNKVRVSPDSFKSH